ncbi:MAG: hypothetical protein WA102_02125 [Candidatus Methanoperedens sp.]
MYTYCFAIRGRGVENPQGFGVGAFTYGFAIRVKASKTQMLS